MVIAMQMKTKITMMISQILRMILIMMTMIRMRIAMTMTTMMMITTTMMITTMIMTTMKMTTTIVAVVAEVQATVINSATVKEDLLLAVVADLAVHVQVLNLVEALHQEEAVVGLLPDREEVDHLVAILQEEVLLQ
jgi:hypothetical protein